MRCNDIQIDNRNSEQFQDLQVNIGPLIITKSELENCAKKLKSSSANCNRNCIFLDRVLIHAHRLFGPRPTSLSYLGKWSIDLGNIAGEVEPGFLENVASAAQVLFFHYVNRDNALHQKNPFPLIGLDVLDISLFVHSFELIVSLSVKHITRIYFSSGLKFLYNDYADEKGCNHAFVDLPSLFIQFLCATESGSVNWNKVLLKIDNLHVLIICSDK
jgi:hypothetical protein